MANATIKISQLPNIGSNLAANTLLPVVDTTGVAITEKVTVGNVANFILTEAGNLLPEAFVSLVTYDVVNAAQPNITSVGNLSGLTITNLSNFKLPGGDNGYVLQTDGAGNLAWTAQAGSGNGNPGGTNTQVQFNDNGLFSGSPALTFDKTTFTLTTVNALASNATIYGTLNAVDVTATGNITGNSLTVNNFTTSSFTTTGNIEANYFIGNGSQLTGIVANASASGPDASIQFNVSGVFDGDANLTWDSATATLDTVNINAESISGNVNGASIDGTVITASYLHGDGSNITNIGNAAYANSSNTSNTAGVANSVAVANVVGIGNISVISLDGNSSNILYGNGKFSSLGLNPNIVVWSNVPLSNNASGNAGEAAYDAGGNLFICVSSDTWVKFTGTIGW